MREIRTDLGRLVISEEAVAAIAGAIALGTPGVAGMAPRGLADILNRDPHAPLGRGVEVTPQGEGTADLTLDIMVVYGAQIQEVAAELEARLRQELPAMTGIAAGRIAVRVQGVRRVDG
ncbi:MAG TPA: Asp23/Gls24 family envelope stress response protein [Bacillota bacterium]|nr:Asp23/Gls24 family envelope stress response protein [Bacillota bacterium]